MTTISRLILAAALTVATIAGGVPAAAAVNVEYLYNLSDFNGTVPYSWSRVFTDRTSGEVYVLSGDSMRVYNPSGMEIYRFDVDTAGALVQDATVDDEGRILILLSRGGASAIEVCDFRGDRIGKMALTALPEQYASFRATRMVFSAGNLYLVDTAAMQIIVADRTGRFVRGNDFSQVLKSDDGTRVEDLEIGAVAVDEGGNVYFTLPIIARVYRVSAEGEIKGFGRRGSAPGRFGVPSGVAVDASGSIYVSDRLRCVVLVFSSDFAFIKEFGFRGTAPGQLIGPNDLATDAAARVYVTQLKSRGVSVYQVRPD